MARILVADDDATIRQVVRFACERMGHQVSEAMDASAALRSYAAQRPDLVVLDMRMPGGGGDTFLKTLHMNAGSCPVLVVTGAIEGTAAQLMAQKGIDAVLLKPFRISDVVAAVERLLKPRA